MKDIRKKITFSAMALSLGACGFFNESKSNKNPNRGTQKPQSTVPTVSEEDVARMPRSFSASDSVVIPRLTIEKEIKEHPENLKFDSKRTFQELVRARAFICSFDDATIAHVLKSSIKARLNGSDEQTMGAFMGRLFPTAQGHFLQNWGTDDQEYQSSEIFANEDAALIRKFYCLGDDPARYVDNSVNAFETLVTTETSAKIATMNLAENLGVDCAVTSASDDMVTFSARWNPSDEFVRQKLPSMKIEWQVDGEDTKLPSAVIEIGSSLKQDIKRSKDAAIYSARLSDGGGRIVLTCARILLPDDDSVGVEPRQDSICGMHTEKQNQAVEYQVEVDTGYRDTPRLKTYETTCGGSVEAYHTACDTGEVMVENSQHNVKDECMYKKEVCVGGGLVPRVCQEIPELRHRNKGSVLCQSQTRATKTETRTRIDVVDVSVANMCDVPFKK